MGQVDVHSDAGLEQVDRNKSNDQGDAGQHFKIYQRFERDASNLGHVGHAGDAVHHRAEDDRRDEHADRLDEGVAQRLHLGAETGVEVAQCNADRHRDQHLKPQLQIPGLLALDGNHRFLGLH